MRSLLLTGLMSLGFAFFDCQGETQTVQESKLQKYFDSTAIEKFSVYDALVYSDCYLAKNLSDDKVDCDEINALSEEDFYTLIERIYELQNFCIMSGYFQEACLTVIYRVEKILKLIDQCRSILPVFNNMVLRVLNQLSDEQYQGLERLIIKRSEIEKKEDSVEHRNMSFIEANEDYILHSTNIEKLRKLRAELREKK